MVLVELFVGVVRSVCLNLLLKSCKLNGRTVNRTVYEVRRLALKDLVSVKIVSCCLVLVNKLIVTKELEEFKLIINKVTVIGILRFDKVTKVRLSTGISTGLSNVLKSHRFHHRKKNVVVHGFSGDPTRNKKSCLFTSDSVFNTDTVFDVSYYDLSTCCRPLIAVIGVVLAALNVSISNCKLRHDLNLCGFSRCGITYRVGV